jgi:hypothetical protein
MQSQHWVQNLIANYAYSRFDEIAPFVHERLVLLEGEMFDKVEAMDKMLLSMGDAEAAEAASTFSYAEADHLHSAWTAFFGEIFAHFVDGYRLVKNPEDHVTGFSKESPHFSDDWKARIVDSTGDHYKVPPTVASRAMSKLTLPALGGRRPRPASGVVV